MTIPACTQNQNMRCVQEIVPGMGICVDLFCCISFGLALLSGRIAVCWLASYAVLNLSDKSLCCQREAICLQELYQASNRINETLIC